jgi:hypothetical protein
MARPSLDEIFGAAPAPAARAARPSLDEIFAAPAEPEAPAAPPRIPEGTGGAETVARGLLPRSFKAEEEGAGVLRKAGAGAMDALSLPGRLVGSLNANDRISSMAPIGMGGTMIPVQPDAVRGRQAPDRDLYEAMADTEGGSIPQQILRDPAMIPSMMVGAPALKGAASLASKVGRTALAGAKGGAVAAGLHQGDRLVQGGTISPGEAVAEVAINTVAPVALSGLAGAAKKGVGGLKTILSKFSEIDEKTLKAASNPATLQAARQVMQRTGGDLSSMADDLGQKTAGLQADEAAAEAAVNAHRQAGLEKGLQKARPWADNLEVSPYDAGKRIETAAQGAREAAGQRFQTGQDAILEGRGIGRKGVQFGGLDGNQTPFEQTVDRFLADAGVGQGGKTYGVIGNVSIPAGAINEMQALKGTFKTGLTTRDMLDQLRLVDNRLNFGGDAGGRLFASGSQEDLAMKGLRARLADDLENQIARAAGKEKNTVLAAWQAHREAYHNTAGALEKIQDGLGAGTLNHEAYFNRIKNIGVEDLRGIAAEAKKNPDLAPTWNELRKGFFDNILASANKGDGVDFQALKKTWDAMDDDLKTTMMPTKVISHIDGVLERTKPINFEGQRLADGNRWMGRDRQSSLSSLENIGSKAKRSDLEDLRTLDDLLGLEGKDRLSEQAESFYLGKQLGMTDKGALPMFSGSRTGARNTGALLGASVGGALGGQQAGVEGGGVGLGAGALAGIALQSPAGALMAYKLLNQIRKGAVVAERQVIRPAARHGLTGARATRGLTTPLFGGGREE